MHSISTNPERSEKKTGVVLLFNPALAKKRPKPCIFCGETLHLQTFKGKPICFACLQRIPSLFVCS